MSAVAIRDNAARATNKKAQGIIDALNAELAALRTRCERAEAELNAIRKKVDPFEGQTLIEAIDYLLLDDSSAEIYRAELSNVTAERDVMATALQGETKLIARLTELTAERDAARDALKVYERQKALRQ